VTALLVDALLENSPKRPQTRVLEWTLSLAVHGILVAAMFVLPLYWIDRIEVHPRNYTQLVATTAESRSNAHLTPAPQSVVAATRKLVAPKSIPNPVVASRQKLGEPDAGAETAPDVAATSSAAEHRTAPDGLLDSGGILADKFSAHLPSPVPEARPSSPLSVGGKVKAPQLISMVAPLYPPLLRRAKVQGDVVIDALIDTEGNVVEEHTVSGNELLGAAAMDALRRWKYQPTVLDGQVFSVHLRVTIAFRLGRKNQVSGE
jgi:protein TonB